MRGLVAGGRGELGRRSVRQLAARNHRVVGLARSETAEATVRSLGGEPRRADLFDANAVAQAAQGCEIIIRAATAIPTKVRSGPKDWVMNDRIRREGTRSLVAATARVGARAFLQESVVEDRPVTLVEFPGEMAKRLGARPPRRMPRWLARMFLGRYGTRLLTSSFSTSNARFRRDFGWRPSFPTYEEGLDEVVKSWRAEGFPSRRS